MASAARGAAYLTRMFGLTDKVAFVTGSARGIGFEMTRGLVSAGCRVCMSDLNNEAVKNASQMINEEFEDDKCTVACQVDVTTKSSVQKMIDYTLTAYDGRLDIAVNNAGIAISGMDEKKFASVNFSEEDWQSTLDVNLSGVLYGCQLSAKHFISSGTQGSIINTASMSAQVVNWPQKQAAYNATKAGVVQLSKCLAVEWAEHGIRVNTISPAYINTLLNQQESIKHLVKGWADGTPMKRLGEPEELVGTLLYLASNNASSYTTGSDVLVDGGFTLW